MNKNEIYELTIEDIGTDGEGIGHVIEADVVTGKGVTGANGSSFLAGQSVDAGNTAAAEKNRGIAVFVKDTVVGDVVSVKIIKVKKNYAYGRLMEIIKPSPYRVEAVCGNARRCGGCAIMHMSYDKQLEYKRNKVKNCLERIGGLSDVENIMEPIYGMQEPYHYRNKMQFPVGLDKDGQVQIGFYAGRTHSIIDLEQCAIGHPVNDYIVKHMRNWLQKYQNITGSFVYNEEAHKGLVRHILTRVGFTTGELMVCVVINGNSLDSGKKQSGCKSDSQKADIDKSVIGKSGEFNNSSVVERELLDALNAAVSEYNVDICSEQNRVNVSGLSADMSDSAQVDKADGACKGVCGAADREIKLTSVSININKEKTNKILGDRCVTLYGQDYISDYIGDIRFNISPLSFYQVNPAQTKVLYDKAVEYADLTGEEVVWDMYCGIGTISLCLAKRAKKVYGVEIVPQAIEDAKENAEINDIRNTEFFCGKAEEVVPAFYDSRDKSSNNQAHKPAERSGEDSCNGRHPDVVVVDPPRKGCDSVLLDTIDKMAPKRLVYVSCDPATLARDVKILCEKGFGVEKVAVVDQFGHSTHVESVVLLSRA